MPELPEVEILVRHLQPLLKGKTIRNVEVRRPKVVLPSPVESFSQTLKGVRFKNVTRRGKYLLFSLKLPRNGGSTVLVGHLGMTGRMYLLATATPLPKHAAVIFGLGRENFVFEDTRYFGRLTLDSGAIARLGPEPLSREFSAPAFAEKLARSSQAIKVKLLDQTVVAGVGNIYASEALFRARISPRAKANRLTLEQIQRLHQGIRAVLTEAIQNGSTVPLSFSGRGKQGRLFYFGRVPGAPDYYTERLKVYDRAGKPCSVCGAPIQRQVQAARSTFFCPECQPLTTTRRSTTRPPSRPAP